MTYPLAFVNPALFAFHPTQHTSRNTSTHTHTTTSLDTHLDTHTPTHAGSPEGEALAASVAALHTDCQRWVEHLKAASQARRAYRALELLYRAGNEPPQCHPVLYSFWAVCGGCCTWGVGSVCAVCNCSM